MKKLNKHPIVIPLKILNFYSKIENLNFLMNELV